MEEEVLTEEEATEERNKWVIRALYEALNSGDAHTVHRLLAPDLEWRFHGPPALQHMLRLLTGSSTETHFPFLPSSLAAFGPVVLAEGTDALGEAFWIHAWTVGPDGVVTQVREYFNTSLTVTRLPASSSSTSSCEITCGGAYPSYVWRSSFSGEELGRSVPALVLAI